MSVHAAPEIRTARLRLRAHRSEDYQACCAMWAHESVTRFIGGTRSTPQQTWARVLAYAGHWAMLGFGYWAIEDAVTPTFVGEVGFADFKRDIGPEMRGFPELGFALAPEFHGSGLATEAVGAVVSWGDRHLTARRTVCLIDPQNSASLRVAQKSGYEIFEHAMYNGAPALFLCRERDASAD